MKIVLCARFFRGIPSAQTCLRNAAFFSTNDFVKNNKRRSFHNPRAGTPMERTLRPGEPTQEEQNIVKNTLSEWFCTDRYIPAQQWSTIINRILGLPVDSTKLVTPVNLNSVILRACEEMDRIKIGKSYSDYAGLENLDPGQLYPLLQLVINVDIKDEEEFVLKIARRYLDKDQDGIPVNFCHAVDALTKTKEWRRGVELLFDLETNSSERDTRPRINITASKLASKALQEGDEETMWWILESRMFHVNSIPVREQHCTIHAPRDAFFCHWIEHCSRFGDIEETLAGLRKLFEYLQRLDIHLGSQPANLLETLYNKFPGYRGSVTKISPSSGVCRTCGTVLKQNNLTSEEMELLKTSVLNIVLKRKDIYQSTSPTELDGFMKMLNREGKFDVVIDGLNVSLLRTPGLPANKPLGLASANLLETVFYFHSLGKRIMVFHRPNVKNYPHYAQIDELCHLHVLDRLTEDDPFFLIASLHSGAGCLCVTSDLLRQHLVKLHAVDPALAKLFNRWQLSHQVYLTGFAQKKVSYSGKPFFIFPPVHAVQPLQAGARFHIPLLSEQSRNGVKEKTIYSGLTANWLCLGPMTAQQEKTRASAHLEHLGKRQRHSAGDELGGRTGLHSAKELKEGGNDLPKGGRVDRHSTWDVQGRLGGPGDLQSIRDIKGGRDDLQFDRDIQGGRTGPHAWGVHGGQADLHSTQDMQGGQTSPHNAPKAYSKSYPRQSRDLSAGPKQQSSAKNFDQDMNEGGSSTWRSGSETQAKKGYFKAVKPGNSEENLKVKYSKGTRKLNLADILGNCDK